MVLLTVLIVAAVSFQLSLALTFKDVSIQAGMNRLYGRQKKYGGASVADLDGDGHQDLIFGHHDEQYAELYFNRGDGTFERSPWFLWTDAHGFNAFRFFPWEKQMHFAVSQGGAFGTKPATPLLYSVRPDRQIFHLTGTSGFDIRSAGRGRTIIFMSLQSRTISPDAIVTNLFDPARSGNYHHGFRVSSNSQSLIYEPLKSAFVNDLNVYGTVADVDGDGRVELISMHELRIYKNDGYFTLKDISASVLPPLDYRGTVAVAELDFNNDGLWDLYVARTDSGDLSWLEGSTMNDYLLQNVGGRYVDVSTAAGIPKGKASRGVTTGDFNNDGFVDIIVTLFNEQDLMLTNNGDGTFRTSSAGFNRSPEVNGDMATAVDLNYDGKLDVVLSEGDWINKQKGGYYRIMKNISSGNEIGNYLLVRVKSAPSLRATSLHAVVTVRANGLLMKRRVGCPGTAVSNSYIELLHFGIGNRGIVNQVTVRWIDGSTQTQKNVLARSAITFGM